jgi:hypothetical protein
MPILINVWGKVPSEEGMLSPILFGKVNAGKCRLVGNVDRAVDVSLIHLRLSFLRKIIVSMFKFQRRVRSFVAVEVVLYDYVFDIFGGIRITYERRSRLLRFGVILEKVNPFRKTKVPPMLLHEIIAIQATVDPMAIIAAGVSG